MFSISFASSSSCMSHIPHKQIITNKYEKHNNFNDKIKVWTIKLKFERCLLIIIHTINSAHDGIHADEVITLNEDDNTNYTRTINIKNIGSQAIEGTTKKCGGYINLTSGTYNIDSAESVFKTDTELNILKDAKVVATNIKGEPVVKQTKDEVEENITIPVLNVNVEGTFTSNGNSITSKKCS